MKTEIKNKILAGVGIIGLVLAGVTGAVAYGSMNSAKDTIQTLNEQVDALKALPAKEVIKEVKVEVPVEKIVNVTITKEVPVDNGNLGKALEFIQDNVDEDIEIDYIVFETDAVNLAEGYINSKMVTLLDDNDFFDNGAVFEDFRKSEVSVKKISDVEIVSRDFEDKDVELEYVVKVKAKEGSDDAIYKEFKVVIPFEEGSMVEDDIEVELI
jgi:hypothetical protein